MPVVTIKFERLRKLLPGISIDTVLETLPFVGLDIEDIDQDTIRVEYNPNRPDLSSDYGVARALRGLLGVEIGLPKLNLVGKSGLRIKVDNRVRKIRPHIKALIARNGTLDDETLRQLISMQEDLHNGLGRRRRKASIGIHNLDAVRFPVTYKTASKDDAFRPLDESSEFTIESILTNLDIGKKYGYILSDFERYPIIVDSVGTVLSLPPIINGDETKVTEDCRNLFVEITAIDQEVAEDILAIFAMTLYDAGFQIWTVNIESGGKKIETPEMHPKIISANIAYINNILGLTLNAKQVITCLKKSRLDAKAIRRKIICTIPRYRIDLFDPVDISEEVAIGFGVYNLEPKFPVSPTAGKRDYLSIYFNTIRETMIGLGMLETLSFLLTSREILYSAFGISGRGSLSVESSKSMEHQFLRDSLIPLLLYTLSNNIHEEYPQRLFELGKTFHESSTIIEEKWNVGAVIAHADVGYSEIKSSLQALFRSCFGKEATTRPSSNHMFMEGRCAEVVLDGKPVGVIGEINPVALENLKLRVPVAAFEIDLLSIIKDK
jgi:phenylalanyl-tRNA synthetase beta chain